MPKLKPVVIFGIGDFAQVASVYLANDSPLSVAAFTVHEDRRSLESVLGIDVVSFESLERTHPPSEYDMLVAIGYRGLNRLREEIANECRKRGYDLITYINSRAVICSTVTIGTNCFIFEHNVIQPFVQIGDNVVMWSGNHIGHHALIEDNCFISSHSVIAGRVLIGHHSFVGVNTTFKDHVRVAPRNVIGAGSLVTRDTEPDQVFAADSTRPSRIKSYQVRGLR